MAFHTQTGKYLSLLHCSKLHPTFNGRFHVLLEHFQEALVAQHAHHVPLDFMLQLLVFPAVQHVRQARTAPKPASLYAPPVQRESSLIILDSLYVQPVLWALPAQQGPPFALRVCLESTPRLLPHAQVVLQEPIRIFKVQLLARHAHSAPDLLQGLVSVSAAVQAQHAG